MNDFEIKILEYESAEEANDCINDFIDECTEQGLEILDMKSHVIVNSDGYYSYTFIFKLKWNREKPRKKVWNDERWD